MTIAILADGVGQNSALKPTLPRTVSQRLGPKMPVVLSIKRAGITGTVAVYGASLPHIYLSSDAQLFRAAAAQVQFNSNITYAAFSNYNWIVKSNGVVLTHGATAAATHYQISDNSGSARITLGAAPGAGTLIEVYKVTPTTLHTAATEQFVDKQITAEEAMWVVVSDTASASLTDVTLWAAAE